MESDNVARRMKSLIVEVTNLPPNIVQIDGWRSVLRLTDPQAPVSVVLARIGPVYQLPFELRNAIEPLVTPGYEQHFLAWVPHVERAFSTVRLDGPWAEFRDPLTHHEVGFSLTACELAFDQRPSSRVVDSERLDQLRTEVAGLADDVRESAELGPEVQAFILKHLRDIDQAISDARFRGVASIEEAAERATGALLRRPDAAAKAQTPTFRRYTALLRTLLLWLRVATGTLQLADSLEEHLDRWLPAAAEIDSDAPIESDDLRRV